MFEKQAKQRNYVARLKNQSKQEYFDNLTPFLDLKPFWKSCKLHFSKHFFCDSIIDLKENGENFTKKNF